MLGNMENHDCTPRRIDDLYALGEIRNCWCGKRHIKRRGFDKWVGWHPYNLYSRIWKFRFDRGWA